MLSKERNLNAGAWTTATPKPGRPALRITDARAVNQQFVVVYGRCRTTRVYCTVYTPADGQGALERCVAAHGRWVCARLVPSRSGDPAAL